MRQSLQTNQSQQLLLTPQLKQSLAILQLSQADLDQLIEQELVNNPLLEREETSLEQPSSLENRAAKHDNSSLSKNSHEDWETPTYLNSASHRVNEQNTEGNLIEQVLAAQESLQEYVLTQIRLSRLSQRDQLIGKALAYSLDDEGYLPIETQEVAAFINPSLKVDVDEINAVLSFIKSIEPIGIGASNLQERILLLIAQNKPFTSPSSSLFASNTLSSKTKQHAAIIVSNHFELLCRRDFANLRKLTKLNSEELSQAHKLITSLNPRVGALFSDGHKQHVKPDVLVYFNQQEWSCKLLTDKTQKLQLNQQYLLLLKDSPDKNSAEFLNHHREQAQSFIKAVGNRYDTMLAVANVIVSHQTPFFDHGVEYLKPMTLQDVASILNVHESTVSRATRGKYLQSERGVFEMKYFFSSAISKSDGGQATSSTAVQSLIKQLISDEPPNKPLSDNKIANELKSLGHVVARRTVAKYRESLQIAPSNQRKTL